MKKIAAFTGAGISKASGIPTFQDMPGIREKLSIDYFRSSPEDFYATLWTMKKAVDIAMPNAAHQVLADYGIPVVTMNIDGLHKRAGSKRLVEIHGNLDDVFCTVCGKQFAFASTAGSLFCSHCRGLLKPDVVLYGEMIGKYDEAMDLVCSAEELLVVGTSFYTSTASYIVNTAEKAGLKIKIINSDAESAVPRYLQQELGRP